MLFFQHGTNTWRNTFPWVPQIQYKSLHTSFFISPAQIFATPFRGRTNHFIDKYKI